MDTELKKKREYVAIPMVGVINHYKFSNSEDHSLLVLISGQVYIYAICGTNLIMILQILRETLRANIYIV
jgi:hypothetical protein